ncbi:MAG: LOG family protein [Chloroflexota bacterium]
MKITVFGSSRPKAGQPAYETAMQLGRMIAEGGHIVLTGGYMGTMEAVSRGAAEAGGHVIGVTCEEIERWRKNGPNPWVKEEWRCQTLLERMQKLIYGCDSAIVLPGGPGTLAETTLYWNLLVIHALPPRPLVLFGHGWKTIYDTIRQQMEEYAHSGDWDFLQFASTIEQAYQMAIRQ